MKRSEINAVVRAAEADFARAGFTLPPFGRWTPDEWRANRGPAALAVKARLGWDLTDFAEGRFGKKGLLLFTVRNGLPGNPPGVPPYAEKIMISRQDQLTPMHRHVLKTEDIINRASLSGNARLAIKLFRMAADGSLDRKARVPTLMDGVAGEVEAGSVVELAPGASITLFPGIYHAFWGEGGDVMIGEVSSVNDDATDNFFAEPLSRFTPVEEDEPPHRLLVADYAAALES